MHANVSLSLFYNMRWNPFWGHNILSHAKKYVYFLNDIYYLLIAALKLVVRLQKHSDFSNEHKKQEKKTFLWISDTFFYFFINAFSLEIFRVLWILRKRKVVVYLFYFFPAQYSSSHALTQIPFNLQTKATYLYQIFFGENLTNWDKASWKLMNKQEY